MGLHIPVLCQFQTFSHAWGSRGTRPQFLTTVCIPNNKVENIPALKKTLVVQSISEIFLNIDVQPRAIFEQKKI
jgi:hypothetical protein